jgi:hypothetical protein
VITKSSPVLSAHLRASEKFFPTQVRLFGLSVKLRESGMGQHELKIKPTVIEQASIFQECP